MRWDEKSLYREIRMSWKKQVKNAHSARPLQVYYPNTSVFHSTTISTVEERHWIDWYISSKDQVPQWHCLSRFHETLFPIFQHGPPMEIFWFAWILCILHIIIFLPFVIWWYGEKKTLVKIAASHPLQNPMHTKVNPIYLIVNRLGWKGGTNSCRLTLMLLFPYNNCNKSFMHTLFL